MGQVGLRYAVLVGAVFALFSGFVACGAQLYQVSLTDDSSPRAGQAQPISDPNDPSYGLHSRNGWRDLPIRFRTGATLTPEQRKGLMAAMATWEMAVGRRLFRYEGVHEGVTGDTFRDLYSSLDDSINGHYLDDHWDKTGKPAVVLATTIWDNDPNDPTRILTSDIRFNSDYYMLGDSFVLEARGDREVVDIQTLALHELGHLLGLAHIPAQQDSQSIMTPSLYIGEGLANRRLSRGDLERVQKVYGCEGTSCDLDATLARIDRIDAEGRSAETAASGVGGTETDTAH